jgi:hypothetical protein
MASPSLDNLVSERPQGGSCESGKTSKAARCYPQVRLRHDAAWQGRQADGRVMRFELQNKEAPGPLTRLPAALTVCRC